MAQQLDDLDTDPAKVKIQIPNLTRNLRIVAKYSDNENIKELCKLRDSDILKFEECMKQEKTKSIAQHQIPKAVTDFMMWMEPEGTSQVLDFCQPSVESFKKALEFLNQEQKNLFCYSPAILITALQTIDTFRQIEYHKTIRARVSKAKNYSDFVKKMANQFKLLNGDEEVAGFTGPQYQEFKDRVITIIRHKSLV